MEKTWKLNDAGTLDIIAGVIMVLLGMLSPFAIWELGIPGTLNTRDSLFVVIIGGIALLALGLLTIYGGEMAIKRSHWCLAFAASICASLVILGIPSFILTILSRKEFARESFQEKSKQKDEK
jgi:uncharacterized membrane protein